MSEATFIERSSVGVRELKNQLSSYLDRVKTGEEITVTEHGWPIARLTAVEHAVDARAALIEAGIIRPAGTGKRVLPSQRVTLKGGAAVADLVADQRR